MPVIKYRDENGDIHSFPLVAHMDCDIIAGEFSTSTTYNVGDYCTYQGTLYKCRTAITTAENWIPVHWTRVTVSNEFSDLEQKKQDNLEFEGNYNAYTNKVATRSFVENTVAGASASGTPIIVSDVADMTDTSRLYVLSEDQHIYQYSDGSWHDTGVSFSGTGSGGVPFDSLTFDRGYLHILQDGDDVVEPCYIGTGGGGGGGAYTLTMTLTDLLGSTIINTASDSDVILRFNYVSEDENHMNDSDGSGQLYVNGVAKGLPFAVRQGENELNIRNYIIPGSNNIKITVTNTEDNSKSLRYTVNVIVLKITTNMPEMGVYEGNVQFTYTLTGTGNKTVSYFIDGDLIHTDIVSTSGRPNTYVIPAQSNGDHYLTVYAELEVDNAVIQSNIITIGMIWSDAYDSNLSILLFSDVDSIVQGNTLTLRYWVHNPNPGISGRTSVALSIIDENSTVYGSPREIEVAEGVQTWSTDNYPAGNTTFRISASTINGIIVAAEKTISVEPYQFALGKVTSDLILEFDPTDRSNGETATRDQWSYGDYTGTFSGFGWSTVDGWLTDNDGAYVLRFLPGDQLYIDCQPFARDLKTNGYTIEVELATREVQDYDSIVMSTMSNNRGFEIKSQKATLQSSASEISMQFKEDSKIRIAFVVESRLQNRLIYIYVNGIMCGVTQYPPSDEFYQFNPVGISIGAESCGIDLYRIRCYTRAITTQEQLDNYIYDRPTLAEKRSLYDENDVFDGSGNVSVDKLPIKLPYMIITTPVLPQSKGDKKNGVEVRFVNPINSARSFTATGVQMDVQGTSSQGYPVKNYKLKLNNGTDSGGEHTNGYRIFANSIPAKVLCLKADYASSEGCNNVELVEFYEKNNPYKAPPQLLNESVRTGVEGTPIVVFWTNPDTGDTRFIGKYNMNTDKGSEAVFGFDSDTYPALECWEFLNNTSSRTLFHSADFNDTSSESGWQNDFEARFPDPYSDISKLAIVAQFIVDHDRDAITVNSDNYTLIDKYYWDYVEKFGMSPKTENEMTAAITAITNKVVADEDYVSENLQDTTDDVEELLRARTANLAEFRSMASTYFYTDGAGIPSAFLYYYLFTEIFLMVDSRAKNLFLTTFDGQHWMPYQYDMDTGIGM